MRNLTLHRALEAYAVDAAGRLAAEAAAGAEMPFELVAERGAGRVPLYCYRPLTADFIAAHMGTLSALRSHGAALRALSDCAGLERYLAEHGAPPAADPRVRCDAVLEVFLGCVFCERTGFGFEPAQFEGAYAELERSLYEGHCTATVIAPLEGVVLTADDELQLGDGLSLIRGDALADVPAEAVWGEGDEPRVLAMLAVDQGPAQRAPVAAARDAFARILSALRLFERGGYAVGPMGWARTDAGSWRAVALGVAGRPRQRLPIGRDQLDELRAFCRLAGRAAATPELDWALARFEMGCERADPLQALSDNLLALRALLEPEGPASGRLAQRLAVICAPVADRAALAERTARAIALEQTVIAGLAHGRRDEAIADELAENLRAILRDALCGHLQADLVALADELLAEAADPPGEPADSVPAAAGYAAPVAAC
ncbi:MAG: hypothetical protein ACYCXW_03155 [Solirubrobacteraceae bacterium]